jgi:ABC-type lipoprotein release transport system permease subunit
MEQAMSPATGEPLAPPASERRFRLALLMTLPFPVRSVLRRWRGMVGMVLGVGIALGVGMTLLGIAKGSIDVFTIDFRRSAASLYVVTEGGKLIPTLPGDSPGTITNARHLLAQISGQPDVRAAVGLLQGTLVRDRGGRRDPDKPAELFVALGVDGDPGALPGLLVMKEGRWLRRTDEVVLGSQLSREKSLHPGDRVRLSGRDFTVVGTGRLRGLGTGTRPDAIAYVDYQALRQRTDSGDVMGVILVDAAHPGETRQRIDQLGSLTVLDPDELARQTADANAAGIGLNWMLIVLTLSIAGLFVSTMLGRSVTERRLEFATLRAIGVPVRTIVLTVAAEALSVGLTASVLGVGFSLCLGALVNRFAAPAYGVEFIYAADASLYLLVFALALTLGILSGLFPARQAVRVDPADVLREA